MIITPTKIATAQDFETLLENVQAVLKKQAKNVADIHLNTSWRDLEKIVFKTMTDQSIGTIFEGSIKLIAGQKFPDITANGDYFGVEVKSSQNNWKSTGNSVLESSRVDNVENIYMFFGKLSAPVDFKYRKYEDCLYDIAVTHSPRYLIDMNLEPEDTIFNKMNIEYDTLRKLEKPLKKVVEYYKSKLENNQDIWWIDPQSHTSLIIKQWGALNKSEKQALKVKMLAIFLELIEEGNKKYSRATTWLFTRHSTVCASFRDIFTAGGKRNIFLENNSPVQISRVLARIDELRDSIKLQVQALTDEEILQYWRRTDVPNDRWSFWVNEVIKKSKLSDRDKTLFIAHLLNNS